LLNTYIAVYIIYVLCIYFKCQKAYMKMMHSDFGTLASFRKEGKEEGMGKGD
jgi:hypothetical protein